MGHPALVIMVPALEEIHGDAQFFGLSMVKSIFFVDGEKTGIIFLMNGIE